MDYAVVDGTCTGYAKPAWQSEKATGHEPLIEPWLTLKYQVRLPSFKTRLACSPPADETRGNGKPARAKPLDRIEGHTSRQWAVSRDKNLLGLRSWRSFFLDIPFYRTH